MISPLALSGTFAMLNSRGFTSNFTGKLNGEKFRLWHNFERYIPDAPPPRAPRDLRTKTRAPLDIYPPAPKLNGERISTLAPCGAELYRRPTPSRTPMRTKTRAPLVRLTSNFHRPSFHHPLS
ncbi:hypothetical protein niasHT_011759 [Heterodera trifolii]|uniref:Uncharacterized protein n=1 Tax=Heterodera trifolii TaxID=157864 RepID=A0ABD2LGV2_9BILA